MAEGMEEARRRVLERWPGAINMHGVIWRCEWHINNLDSDACRLDQSDGYLGITTDPDESLAWIDAASRLREQAEPQPAPALVGDELPDEWEQLERFAKAATKGKWIAAEYTKRKWGLGTPGGPAFMWLACRDSTTAEPQNIADAAYICAAGPERVLRLIAELRAALATRPAVGDEWVSVSERLPDGPEDVLVLQGNAIVGRGYYYGLKTPVDGWRMPNVGLVSNVTHWRPLPAPPAALAAAIGDADGGVGPESGFTLWELVIVVGVVLWVVAVIVLVIVAIHFVGKHW